MKWTARISGLLLLVLMLSMTTGCRYMANRYYDFRDTFAVGAGVTAENPFTPGVVPPSLGVYAELTDLFQFGAITHNGYTAELDLRGSYVGPESETRFGFLWWQMLRKQQSYDSACYKNAFKDRNFPWCQRMESLELSKHGKPAKRLYYDYWENYMSRGTWLLHHGWQYWEYSGIELAVSDPLLTHWGFMVKFGVDVSEVSDFIAGWFGLDYKHDDMTRDEWEVFRQCNYDTGLNLTPARPRPASDDRATTSAK